MRELDGPASAEISWSYCVSARTSTLGSPAGGVAAHPQRADVLKSGDGATAGEGPQLPSGEFPRVERNRADLLRRNVARVAALYRALLGA